MKKMITRRQFMAAAGVVAAASALTACGGSSASTAASSAAGSTAGSAAASGSTIKVGVLGPMTGDVSVYGLAVINGATLYLKLPTNSFHNDTYNQFATIFTHQNTIG